MMMITGNVPAEAFCPYSYTSPSMPTLNSNPNNN